MTADPAIEAHSEAHHAAARELRRYAVEAGVDIMKAGIAAELAVEAAWPIVEREAYTRAAEAIEARAGVNTSPSVWRLAAELVRGLAGPLPDGGLIAPIPEHLFKCPSDCTDVTPIVSVGWSTPTREVKPWDEDFDPASPFVQHKPDPDNNTTNATHASGLEHELPYDTRIGTSFGGVGK